MFLLLTCMRVCAASIYNFLSMNTNFTQAVINYNMSLQLVKWKQVDAISCNRLFRLKTGRE